MKIQVGFVDVPYALSSYGTLGVRRRKRPKRDSTKTTLEVATILERRYHIQEFFLEHHKEEISEIIMNAYNTRLEEADRAGRDPEVRMTEAEQKAVTKLFIDMIENRELDGQPGVPTEASKGYTRRDGRRIRRRPSFRDTRLYERSFRMWLEP